MGIGRGPGKEMQSDYNRNRGALSGRRSLEDISKDFSEKDRSPYRSKASMSKEELEQFKAEFKALQIRRRNKAIVIFAISLILTTVLFVWFLS